MSDCSRRSTRNFVPSPCGAEKSMGIFPMVEEEYPQAEVCGFQPSNHGRSAGPACARSEEHTSELQSRLHLVCRLLLEKKKQQIDEQVHLRHGRAVVQHI